MVKEKRNKEYDLIFDHPTSTRLVIQKFKERLNTTFDFSCLAFIAGKQNIEDRLAIGLNWMTLEFIFQQD